MESISGHAFLTVAEVARLCRVHEITVRRHIKQGRLHAVRVGRSIRVPRENLELYLDSQEWEAIGGLLKGDDPTFKLMGAFEDKDGATDVSENKYKYLANTHKGSVGGILKSNDPILALEGIAVADVTDLSENKYKYFDEAFSPDS